MGAHIIASSLKGPVCEQICVICLRQSISKGFFNVIFLKAQCREIFCDVFSEFQWYFFPSQTLKASACQGVQKGHSPSALSPLCFVRGCAEFDTFIPQVFMHEYHASNYTSFQPPLLSENILHSKSESAWTIYCSWKTVNTKNLALLSLEILRRESAKQN